VGMTKGFVRDDGSPHRDGLLCVDDSAEMDSCSTRTAELAAELMDKLMTKVHRVEETNCAEEKGL
jgi:hypothetical protein